MAGSTLLARAHPLAALRHPGYRRLIAGVTPHMLSIQMSSVALGYLAFQLSGSATTLGLIGLGWGLPMLGLALVGGVVADRFPRQIVLLGTQGIIGLAALLGAMLLLTGVIQVWHVLLIALLQGTAFAFNMPARQALIGDLVGAADLGNAIALNNALMNGARVIGPPIAGVLIGSPVVGISGVFVLMAAAYVVVLLTLAGLPRVTAPARKRRSGWGDLVAGLRFVVTSPALLGLLALGFAPAALGMPYQLLLPVFALRVYEAGPEGLGLLGMANGLGALAGSVGVTVLADSRHRRLIQTVLGVGFGAGLVGFALSPNLAVAAVLLGLTGAASAGYMSINNSLIMQTAPGEFHGRVMSVYMLTFAAMPLTSLPAARLADLAGAPATVGGMGALLIVAVLVITAWQRRVAARQAPAPRAASAD